MAEPNPTGVDAYKPSEIYALVDRAGVQKAELGLPQLLVLSILAGAFIALGAAAFTMVIIGTDMSFGPARFLGGIVFSLGLILVIVAGAELFTGNALLVIAVVEKLVSPAQLLRNWAIVYICLHRQFCRRLADRCTRLGIGSFEWQSGRDGDPNR